MLIWQVTHCSHTLRSLHDLPLLVIDEVPKDVVMDNGDNEEIIALRQRKIDVQIDIDAKKQMLEIEIDAKKRLLAIESDAKKQSRD
jgi:hypothetical protein